MSPKLYSFYASPPCRAVIATAAVLNIDLDVIEVALLNGETRTPEFLQINPQHAVPTLDDDSFILGESRAIMEYLVDKYGEKSQLYPKDMKTRALISSRLYFDSTAMYPGIAFTILQPMFSGAPFGDTSKLQDVLNILDALIGGKEIYLVNNQMTIADIALATTISTYEAVEQDISDYRNIVRWYNNIKRKIPNFVEINEPAQALIGQKYRTKLAKSKFF